MTSLAEKVARRATQRTASEVPTDYLKAKERRDHLESEVDRTGKALKALSGGGPMGMTPEHVRATPEWKAANHAADVAFAELRAFNAVYVKRFKKEITQERRVKLANDDSELEPDIGELEIADYVVFLLALDTYMRYLHESDPHLTDDLVRKGINLIRSADRQHLDALKAFLASHLPTHAHKLMLEKAFRFLPNANGIGRRALQLRTVLSRGGASTMRACFKSNRALQEVRTAISAAMLDDADSALDKFAAISMRNTRMRAWIDHAAKTAGSGTFQNAVTVSSTQSMDEVTPMLVAKMQQAGSSPTSEESKSAGEKHEDLALQVQQKATSAAEKAMAVSGEPDEPPKRSEVIGLANAAVASALSDPSKNTNVPQSLQGLDPEQRAAALTEGRVLVAAAAGSGKTSTLTARVAYLVQERKVSPSKILVTSFNTKAADEIRERIASKVGDNILNQMSVGTMHSLFRKFVVENGTPEEKAALTTWFMAPPKKKKTTYSGGKGPTPAAFGGYMSRLWKECYSEDPPRGTKNVVQSWMMNDISPEKAKEQASQGLETSQAEWYAWTLGFKGVNKSWEPPCVRSNKKASRIWSEFLTKWRDGGRARIGSFEDMILMFRDLLKRNLGVRKKIQGMFDEILVDEAQDLNSTQHQIIDMMSEHITDGKDGKSLWICGDEVQSVNAWVGAKPELFTQFHGKENWKTRSIATNYRCLPEIVQHANKLLENHPRGIPVEARPDAAKPIGQASIVVQKPATHAQGAIDVVSQIKQDLDAGDPIENYAVLSRTNMELNDYETACIIQGIPYARKGGSSFLKSPETLTVMAYFNLVVGQDFESTQKSLAEVLNKPNRFFLRSGDSERIVAEAVNTLARRQGVSNKNVNPLDLFDNNGLNIMIDAMDPQRRWENWQVKNAREELVKLGQSLHGMRQSVDDGTTVDRMGVTKSYTTQDLFGDILNIKGFPEKRGEPGPTLKDVLMPQSSMHEEENDDPEKDEDENKKPIGNVAFLFQIAQPDPNHPELNPADPRKFKAKIDKLVADSKDLRVDTEEWSTEQKAKPPSERKAPPCVTLSTIHSCKGLQWNNTTVVMAKGVFPFEPKRSMDEDTMSAEQLERLEKKRHQEFLTERQLAYVAMTRAGKNLTIVCPSVNAYGKEAGVSSFVEEAGLKAGQNVPGKNDPTPDPVAPVEEVKTASFDEDYDYSYQRGE